MKKAKVPGKWNIQCSGILRLLPRGSVLVSVCIAFAAGVVALYPGQDPAEHLTYYLKTPPIVNFGVEELRSSYPDLAGLEVVDDQQELVSILLRTGASLEEFFRFFPNTISREKVRQERMGEDGRLEAKLEQESYYLVMARTGRETSGFDESRTDDRGKPIERKRLRGQSFLTSGFAGVGIFFLPINQKEFQYRLLGRDSSRSGAYVIAFSSRRDSSLRGKLEVGEDEAQLLTQGLAWIHPDTFRLLRMTTVLQAVFATKPVILALRTNIQFDEIKLNASVPSFSLPAKVEVNINWRGTIYRNIHRYSDYRLFSIETHETRAPIIKP